MSNVRPLEHTMMPVSFAPIQSLPFDTWRKLWLHYSGIAVAVNPEATFARLVNPAVNLHGIAAVVGKPVGFAHFYFHASTWSEAENCCLQDLYVSPSVRGRKIGKALVEAVATEARGRGCSVLHWRTRESNASANALYVQFAERTEFLSYRLAL